MQLNIYVPHDKAHVVDALERAAKITGRPKNEIVLDALERHLKSFRPPLQFFRLGALRGITRRELYGEDERR